MSVSLSHFSDTIIKGITIQVGQGLSGSVVLQIPTVSSTVTVEGGALAQIDTTSARVGANISDREVAQLPVNGRQVSQLYLMAPGAVNNASGTFDNTRFSGRSNQQNIIRFCGVEDGSSPMLRLAI